MIEVLRMEAKIYRVYTRTLDKLIALMMECYHPNMLESISCQLAEEIQNDECRVTLECRDEDLAVHFAVNEFAVNEHPGDDIYAAATNRTAELCISRACKKDLGEFDRQHINTTLTFASVEWEQLIRDYDAVQPLFFSMYGHLNAQISHFTEMWGEDVLERLGMNFDFENYLPDDTALSATKKELDRILEINPARQVFVVWSVDDVNDLRPDLNDTQAIKVLRFARDKHDASIGISHDSLRETAELLFPTQPE